MSKKSILNPIALGLGAAVVSVACFSTAANAEASPFSVQAVSMQVAANDAADAGAMKMEGKCGAGKKMEEGKCGTDKKANMMKKEGKCGEAKCGAKKKAQMEKMKKEGKCGAAKEGKCGAKSGS